MGTHPEVGGGATGRPAIRLGPLADLYGSGSRGVRRSPEAIWRHWITEWRRRIKEDWDVMIVIDGERGSGKSALAQEIGRRMDSTFSARQIALSAREMLRLYGTLHRGGVAVYDESALGLLSRAFMSEEAIALVQAALIGRKLGVTTVLAIPDLMLLDIAFRESILKYRITVGTGDRGERGIGWVHVRQFSPRYHRSDRRGLYLDREWNPLRWNDPRGSALWTEYLAHADRTARKFALRKAEELEQRERSRRRTGPEEIREALEQGKTDRWIARNLRVGRERVVRLRRKGLESTPED
ncbi:MAG: hypothetical protein L3J96_03945 [Thermoplasmata archaeon]|nr:hypothetical protein [Thermoplasmata archaeon]